MKEKMKELKEQESYIRAELYRVLKDAIKDIPLTDELRLHGRKFWDVFPEFQVNGMRADLVVAAGSQEERTEPFLVIETKKRILTAYAGASCAIKTKQVKIYNDKIGAPYYAICNGWILLLFNRARYPYFLGAYGVKMEKAYALDLLMGLVKYSSNYSMERLNSLPKVPDSRFLKKIILPRIAEYFASEGKSKPSEEVKKEKEMLIKQWISRLKYSVH